MKHHITLSLFCLFNFVLQAQQVEYYYDKKDKEYKCKKGEKFDPETVRNMIAADTIQNEGFLACCYYRLGFHYKKKKNYVEAIQLHKKAASIRETNKDKDGLLWKSYGNIAIAYNNIEYYEKALDYINKAFKVDKQFEGKPIAHIINCHAYRRIGELKKSVEAGRKAVRLAIDTASEGDALSELCLTLIAQNRLKSLTEAIQIADDAIHFYQKKNKKKGVAQAHNYKAQALHELKQYKKALSSYRIAKEKYQEIKDTLGIAWVINNISLTYYEQKEYLKAIDLLRKALELKQKHHNNATYQFDYASTYENLADNYTALKEYDKAIKYYNKAIDNLKDNPKSETPYIYNKPDLLRVLDLKAQAYKNMGKIPEAHRTYADLDNWINEFYKDLSTNESKLTWIARAHAMYAHAIEVALEKGNQEKAFEYAEKAHAVLLWQSLSQQAARSLLSEKEQENMDNLNAKIRQADQQYRYGEIKIDTLRTLEGERDKLEQTFEQQYTEYAQRKYQPEATTVHDIQSKIIDDHTAFIEYYRTDEVLFFFTVTKNDLKITQKNANGLADDIADFVKNISRKKLDVENYHALAHKLYRQLIPSTIRSNDNIKHLIIVPDREIGTLPFAALTTQATSGKLNKNTPFLLKKYTTNYLYSAGSYLQLQQKPANQKYCFAGIAPVEYQMEKWNKKPLPHSEKELDGIKPLHWQWQREILMREQATKAEFERIIQEGYRTIQVSTHAVFDENKGQIIFHDKVITQGEIDQLEINTHRLILSACETGVGTQNQGEGILSLGWNFAYKGVPSITMTHWSVSDNSTKDIMINYHENLNDSTPADQALQNAQQKYLENTPSDKYAAPYFWAAFFHTGNVK